MDREVPLPGSIPGGTTKELSTEFLFLLLINNLMSLTPKKQQILWIQHLKEMNDDLDWLHAHFSYNDRELWYQYREDDYLLNRPSWDFWYDYQNDLHRMREEKIMEIFGLGKETLKDIWPE